MAGIILPVNNQNTKSGRNHEITPAQENEPERSTLPELLTGAGRSGCNAGITPACPALCTSISPGIRRISSPMNPRPPVYPVGDTLARSDGVMTRVRMVNAMLRHLRIDCTELDALAGTGTIQLAAAQAMILAGNPAGMRSALSQFRETVTLLRDAYRRVLIREDLPTETARGVLSIAQSLDVTAVQVGIG
jgi:hypothetical protein